MKDSSLLIYMLYYACHWSVPSLRFSRLIYHYITEQLYGTAHRKQRYPQMLHFQVQQCLPGSLTYCADGEEEGVLLDKCSKHCVTEQCHICFHCTKPSSSLTFLSDSRHKMMFSTNFYLLRLLHIKLHYFRLRKLLNH